MSADVPPPPMAWVVGVFDRNLRILERTLGDFDARAAEAGDQASSKRPYRPRW